MTPSPLTIAAIAFVVIITMISIFLFYQLWKEERAEHEQRYVERFNYASAFLTFCKSNSDFRSEHYDTLINMIGQLNIMPGRNREHVDVLRTEVKRCFIQVILQRHIDSDGFKKRRAKKIAKVEMIER